MSDTSFPFTMPIYCGGKQVRGIEGRCDCNSDSTIDPIIYDLDDKAVIPTDEGHITKRAIESFLWGRYRNEIDECMSNLTVTPGRGPKPSFKVQRHRGPGLVPTTLAVCMREEAALRLKEGFEFNERRAAWLAKRTMRRART